MGPYGWLFEEIQYKIMSTKLGTIVNNYLG